MDNRITYKNGYVYYWITLSDESRFMVFDDGSMIE